MALSNSLLLCSKCTVVQRRCFSHMQISGFATQIVESLSQKTKFQASSLLLRLYRLRFVSDLVELEPQNLVFSRLGSLNTDYWLIPRNNRNGWLSPNITENG